MLAARLTRAIVARFSGAVTPSDPFTTALIGPNIKKGTKKIDRQLRDLKHQLARKEPVRNQSLYEEYHHMDVYKRINTDLEGFFHKRDYTLENFNFLINLLGHQGKTEQVPQVLSKMALMQIEPNQKTYTYLIKTAGQVGNIELAEKYLSQGVKRFGDSNYFYTSLMIAHSRKGDWEMTIKIFEELQEKGLEPTIVEYTTLINCLRQNRRVEKCWDINRQLLAKNIELDESYTSVMLKVHAATHDAEKAVKLYRQQIISKGIKPMIETTNSYLKALASRPEYAPRVIDKFMNLFEEGRIINEETVKWALKAAATSAALNSAIQIVKVMKIKEIEPTKQIYNSLIRVYAKVCELPTLTPEYRQTMIMDTWKLVEEASAKGMVDTTLLNNVMRVHANALEVEKLQGLVLPLYEKHGLQLNSYSYEVLMELHYNLKDFNTALRMYRQSEKDIEERKKRDIELRGKYAANRELLKDNQRQTFNMMETLIQIGIRMMDMPLILEALDGFKKINRHPKNSTLKFLGNLKGLPQQIQVSLMDFKIRFGAAKLKKTKTNSEGPVKDPQDD